MKYPRAASCAKTQTEINTIPRAVSHRPREGRFCFVRDFLERRGWVDQDVHSTTCKCKQKQNFQNEQGDAKELRPLFALG